MKNFSLPVGWRYVSLLDLVDVIGGVAYNPNDITNKGIRIVRGGNIQDNIVKLKDDDVYLPLSYKNDNNSLYKGDIVLVASTGSVEALGRTATVWEDMKDVQIGAFLRILRPKQKQYAAFISAWLSSDHYLKYIKQVAKGTSINNIGQTHLQGFKIPIPLESEIDSISHVYSSLSSKIALNRAINRNLEAFAKQLYDYWFVQFDFPDENGRPYKSSGTMKWSLEVKRATPESFEVVKLGEVCEVLLGGTPDTTNEDYWNGDYHWLNSGEVAEFPILNSEKTITEEGLNSSATAFAPKGSVTLSITRHLRPSILAIDACINQSVVAIKENDKIKKEYLYPLIGHEIPRYMTLRTGAQQPHINKEIVESTWIVMPTDDVLERYYKLVMPIYHCIIMNAKEIENLTKHRDELLPLLMNGQVTIE